MLLHRNFYTQKLLHRSFYTQTLLHTASFYTQKLLHTEAFTHSRFDTQTLLHAEAFYTQKLLHTEAFYTQALLHRDTFTHTRYYTQTLLHTEAFTHRSFSVDFRTEAFTHRPFYTQTLYTQMPYTEAFYIQKLLIRFSCCSANQPNIFNAKTRQTCSTMECCLVMQLADDANSECCTTCSDQAAVAIFNPSGCCTFRSAQQTLLHTDPFITHKPFYTQTILHTDALMQKTLLRNTALTHTFTHTNPFTHRCFYNLLHTDAFTHITFTHKRFYTQMLLHTDAFTHTRFDTQILLHTDDFTHRCFLHTDAFTRKPFYTHTKALTSVFNTRPPFRAKGLRANLRNRNFTTRLDIKTYESEQSAANALLSYKKYHLPQFWTIDVKSQFYDRTSFRAKGLSRHTQNRNFTSQFLAIEPPFVRKGCVSCRLVGTASRLKREIEKAREASGQESKRAREQEGKRARGQERM